MGYSLAPDIPKDCHAGEAVTKNRKDGIRPERIFVPSVGKNTLNKFIGKYDIDEYQEQNRSAVHGSKPTR